MSRALGCFCLAVASLAAAIGLAASAGLAATQTLTLYVSSSYYTTYNATLHVTANAYFTNPACSTTSQSQCDRDVEASFVLRKNGSTYGAIATQVSAHTGQYSSALRANLKIPCKLIPHGTSRRYLLTVDAVAPNGEEKIATSSISIYSCHPA